MRWKRIPKENARQPPKGKNADLKHFLAEEGFHQCVYCALQDATFGERNFHVEHYKPKSNYRFRHLEHNIKNLFYACPVCNVFKGDSWPRAPKKDHSVESYPNPSKCDYCELFDVVERTGEIKGRYVASKFLITKLHLNREQLIIERRIHYYDERMAQLISHIDALKGALVEAVKGGDTRAVDYLYRVGDLYRNLYVLQRNYRKTPDYSHTQLS